MAVSKLSFCQSAHCQTRAHCPTCRLKNEGRQWRQSLLKCFILPNKDEIDFICPWGVPWYPTNEQLPVRVLKVPQLRMQQSFTKNHKDRIKVTEVQYVCRKCDQRCVLHSLKECVIQRIVKEASIQKWFAALQSCEHRTSILEILELDQLTQLFKEKVNG